MHTYNIKLAWDAIYSVVLLLFLILVNNVFGRFFGGVYITGCFIIIFDLFDTLDKMVSYLNKIFPLKVVLRKILSINNINNNVNIYQFFFKQMT